MILGESPLGSVLLFCVYRINKALCVLNPHKTMHRDTSHRYWSSFFHLLNTSAQTPSIHQTRRCTGEDKVNSSIGRRACFPLEGLVRFAATRLEIASLNINNVGKGPLVFYFTASLSQFSMFFFFFLRAQGRRRVVDPQSRAGRFVWGDSAGNQQHFSNARAQTPGKTNPAVSISSQGNICSSDDCMRSGSNKSCWWAADRHCVFIYLHVSHTHTHSHVTFIYLFFCQRAASFE